MDKIIAAVVVVVIFGLIIFAFTRRYRRRVKAEIKGPFGTGLKVEGENAASPSAPTSGIRIKDAEAGRDIRAHSTGAGGVDLEKVKAKGDIDASSSSGDPPPKA